MTNRHNAAPAVGAGACAPAYYASRFFPGMRFLRRTACDSIVMDTPPVPVSELTTDPYADEGRMLAVEDRMRRRHEFARGHPSKYFEWRQAVGEHYYYEQDRLAGRVAANDNRQTSAKAAA